MSDAEATRTAFHDIAAAQGASHAEDGGWMWLEGFGDVAREHAAIRDDVAVWDVSPLNKWEFRGPDALRAVQRVFSNDALGLAVGQARYGALLDADGLMVDDATVFNTAEGDHCWVMTNGSEHAEFFADLVTDLDTEVEWITPSMPHLGVIGPRSREVVQAITDEDLGSLRYFRFIPHPVRVGGVDVHLSRTGYGGELGYELFLVDPADAETLWKAVVGAGAVPIGTDAIEVARVEAGLIIYGYDYEPHERTPYDVGLDKLVRPDLGLGFAGEDALRAVAADPPQPLCHAAPGVRGCAGVRRRGHQGRRGGRRADQPDREPEVRGDRARHRRGGARERGKHAGCGGRRRDRPRHGRRAADL